MLTLNDFTHCYCQIALRHPVRDETIVLRTELHKGQWEVRELTYMMRSVAEVAAHRNRSTLAGYVRAAAFARRRAYELKRRGYRISKAATNYKWIP